MTSPDPFDFLLNPPKDLSIEGVIAGLIMEWRTYDNVYDGIQEGYYDGTPCGVYQGLEAAARGGQIELATFFISQGANENRDHLEGVLCTAIDEKNYAIIHLLEQKGLIRVSPDVVYSAIRNQDIKMVDYLSRFFTQPIIRRDLIRWSIDNGYFHMAEEIAAMDTPIRVIHSLNETKYFGLIKCARKGHINKVRKIFKEISVIPNFKTSGCLTRAKEEALNNRHYQILYYLEKKTVRLYDYEIQSFIEEDKSNLILEYINETKDEIFTATAACAAITSGRFELLKRIDETNPLNSMYSTRLFNCIGRSGSMKCLRYFEAKVATDLRPESKVEEHKNITRWEVRYINLIHHVIKSGNREMTEYVYNRANISDTTLHTLISEASEYGFLHLVVWLEEKFLRNSTEENLSTQGLSTNILYTQWMSHSTPCVLDYFLRKKPELVQLSFEQAFHGPPLSWVRIIVYLRNGAEITHEMAKQKPHLGAVRRKDWTACLRCVTEVNIEVVKYFIRLGANPKGITSNIPVIKEYLQTL